MSPTPVNGRVIELDDLSATEQLGHQLARLLQPGDLVALRGDLGAGKTSLARALIRTYCGHPHLDVPSPTFTLVQSYEAGPTTLWHFDLYRLSAPDEIIELGWDDALIDGIVLVEWPERLGRFLPGERLDITLSQTSTAGENAAGRQATLRGFGAWAHRLFPFLAVEQG